MARTRITRCAANDIREVILTISHESADAATSFYRKLLEKFSLLATTPRIGRERNDYGEGVRTLPFGNYMIFYHATSSGVTILRFLHGARNLHHAFRSE